MSTKLTNRSDSRRKVSSVASSLAPYASSLAQSSAVQSPRINIPLAVTNNINPPVKHNRSLEWNPALYLRFPEVAEFRTRYRDPERRSDSGVGPEGEFGARRSRFGDDGMVPLSSFSRLDWAREHSCFSLLKTAAPMSDLAAFSLSATDHKTNRMSSSSSRLTTPDSRIMSPNGARTGSYTTSTSHRSESPYGPLPSISHFDIGPGDDGIPTLPHLSNILSPSIVDTPNTISPRTLPRIQPREDGRRRIIRPSRLLTMRFPLVPTLF